MSEDDINLAIRESTKFPLTARAKLGFNYRDHLDKEWDNKKKCDALDKQTKGIDSIKAHIAQRKREFLCHHQERVKTGCRRQQELENMILNKYKINLVNDNTRKRIAEKLIAFNKTQDIKMRRKKERMMNIIQQIVGDYEWQEQLGVKKGPTWKPRRKVPPEPSIEEEEEEYESEEVPGEEEWEEIKPEEEKKDKHKKDEKNKEGKDKKDKKPTDDKKTSSDSKTEKKGKEEFIMPEIPTTNPRQKIKALDEVEKIADLLEPLHKYDRFIDEENEFYGRQELRYPVNKTCGSKPAELIFQDFENDKEYKEKLHIHNYGSEIIHCKYYNIKCADEFESTCILVEDVGIQKVLPGRFYPLTIYFLPKELKHLEGELIFTTFRPGKPEIKQFSVPFRCQIAGINIHVNPKNIIFKSLSIWEVHKASDRNYKTIQVQNNMIQDCVLVIRKIKTDLLDVSDNENESKQVEFSTKKNNSKASITSMDYLINDCIDQLSNIFQFSSYFYYLPAKTTLDLKVFWKNGPFVGAHQEMFEFEFVEKDKNDFNVLQCENVLIQTEVTGKFIVTDYEYLDYNICILNHVYQQPINIHNYGKSSVKIGFKYPSKLKQYFSAYPATFFLKPHNHENVSLRFIPRKEILTSQIKYYNPYSNILSCPIKICILSTKNSDIPPTIITLYAILSEPDDIKLRLTSSQELSEEDGCPVINLGLVTTHETVTADFEIENISSVTGEFAFFNLPANISMRPDYGIGMVEPHETKKIEICLSPAIHDLITDELVHESGPINVKYKLSCTTAYKLGGLLKRKPDRDNKTRKELLELQFNQEYLNKIDDLFTDETGSFTVDTNQIHSEALEVLETAPVDHWIEEDELLEEENPTTKNLSIIIKATLIDYWTELSHQYVIFPDTPLGSYTTMDILLSAINNTTYTECVCGFIKKDNITNFDCHFEVTGGCNDITVEPICGDLKKGESVHLLVSAKPSAETQILKQSAKIFKAQKLASMKKEKGGKGKTEAKDKKGSGKTSEKSEAVKAAEEAAKQQYLDSLSLHDCDYYPAEKEIAISMRPYNVKTKFTFVVTFPEHLKKDNEILYLTAECKIIRPDFVTDLATQYIDFGPTVILTRPKIIINLRNVSRTTIHPKISPLNPTGPFTCTTQIQNSVEREHILKIPITFAPEQEMCYREYFDIKSGNTIETLMVSGEGIKPDFEFVPKFTVCRIEAKFGKSTDCIFQVNNNCKAPLNLYFVKTCELKGKIQSKPIAKEEKDKKGKPGKPGKPAKPKKFSEDLSPDEEFSIEHFFELYEGESQFKIMNAKEDVVKVEPFTKLKIKIRFETPIPPPVENSPSGKGKDNKSKASASSKSSKATKGSKLEKGVKYLAKYNIMLGNIVFVKDFVIIAEFN